MIVMIVMMMMMVLLMVMVMLIVLAMTMTMVTTVRMIKMVMVMMANVNTMIWQWGCEGCERFRWLLLPIHCCFRDVWLLVMSCWVCLVGSVSRIPRITWMKCVFLLSYCMSAPW